MNDYKWKQIKDWYELRMPKLTIKLHHWVSMGNAWFMSCGEVGIDRQYLSFTDVELCKKEAILKVKNKLTSMLADVLLAEASNS